MIWELRVRGDAAVYYDPLDEEEIRNKIELVFYNDSIKLDLLENRKEKIKKNS